MSNGRCKCIIWVFDQLLVHNGTVRTIFSRYNFVFDSFSGSVLSWCHFGTVFCKQSSGFVPIEHISMCFFIVILFSPAEIKLRFFLEEKKNKYFDVYYELISTNVYESFNLYNFPN